ncbi:c-type cytochrome [Zymomonas mobilis]|uniref:Cytochrome c class I n=1 Tax=Zymomonas mobilis subsp. pomaceae (strain ATCC 29192 / DSM 22645 / JCM 10191 / CCUG 17912 / NBRC 13757 / NCIMB 11200 / NRRL B-4491 / Barker I) TaxID=579138 RepID=F8EUK0_ZYMMT|nr:cytochrome c [Zymomonas mobilis]AEI37216.1 cytochrome c class I [Zymomonas mobilis subsp. pomaceae ATCC 29192]MDX5948586.1 cytochrome c [Zymomonas mobilis subsp. pomaceae]
MINFTRNTVLSKLFFGTILALMPLFLEGVLAAPPGIVPYMTNCSTCHQTKGEGSTNLAPKLSNRIGKIASFDEGRRYMLSVVFNGMAGRIVVDGMPFLGVMTPLGHLKDEDISGALNYILSLQNMPQIKPFTPAEVKAARSLPKKSAPQMTIERQKLIAAHGSF